MAMSEAVLAELDLANDDPERAADEMIAAAAADIEEMARKMERSPHVTMDEAVNAVLIARELQNRVGGAD